MGWERRQRSRIANAIRALRLVIQRVRRAAVSWPGHRQSIGPGLAILLGAGGEDDSSTAERLAAKVAELRIFKDGEGKTNRSLQDVRGAALVVSQFTLYADLSRGRRPGFTSAGDPQKAEAIYEHFAEMLRTRHGVEDVKTGSFGAEMLLEIENDGPFTLVLSSDDWATNVVSR